MVLTPLFWSHHYLKFAQDLGEAEATSLELTLPLVYMSKLNWHKIPPYMEVN